MLTYVLCFLAGFIFGIAVASLLTQSKISDLEATILYLETKLQLLKNELNKSNN